MAKPKKRPRKFSPQYRAEVVRMVRSGVPVAEVARDFALYDTLVRKWLAKAEDSPEDEVVADPLSSDEREELRDLRGEVQRLREENEVLTKAVALMARERA